MSGLLDCSYGRVVSQITDHRSNKEELKCTKEAVLVISMHSKAPVGDLIVTVPPVKEADVVHGFVQ